MHKPVKYVEKAVTVAATGVWAVFERLNRYEAALWRQTVQIVRMLQPIKLR